MKIYDIRLSNMYNRQVFRRHEWPETKTEKPEYIHEYTSHKPNEKMFDNIKIRAYLTHV